MNLASPPARGGPAWSLNPLLELHWKIWGAECLVFEAVSGETALIDPLDAAVLGCFEAGPQTAGSLREALQRQLGAALAEDAAEQLGAAVREFLARGWLEPVSGAA